MKKTLFKILVAPCLLILVVSALSERADSMPVFARKYGFNCSMCHSNFPRLNDFGQMYRNNGYQLPGQEKKDKTVLESPPPFAVRATAGYNYDKFKNIAGSADVNQFQVSSVDILSAGLLGENIGYAFVYRPQIGASRGVVGQAGVAEAASVVFSDILGSESVNARVGRFEPEYVAFSAKRRISFAPYEIYNYTFPGGAPFSENQEGVEITGYMPSGFSYAAGWLNGSAASGANDGLGDFYVRLRNVFERGQGQTAGQRIGLVAYFGKSRPFSSAAASKETYNRIGLDGSLNFGHANLALQYVRGRDDKALWGAGSDVTFTGGFAELSYLPVTDLAAFARFDMVNTPDIIYQDIRAIDCGLRYHLEDNLATQLEYSRRTQQQGTSAIPLAKARENFFTARIDFAF